MGPYGDFPKLGVPFGGPYNKDYSILGSTLGSSILGNYHIGLASADNGAIYWVGP